MSTNSSIQPSLDMLGLIVSDISRSLDFYRALGLEIPEFNGTEVYHETTLPNGLRISWNTVDLMKQMDPNYVDPVGMRMGMAFLCPSPAEVDEVHARLTSLGYATKHDPFDAFWGQRYATILDPDGNAVDLFAPLATELTAQNPGTE